MPKKLTALFLRILLLLTIFIGLGKQIKMAAFSLDEIFAVHEEPKSAVQYER